MSEVRISIVGDVENCPVPSKCLLYSLGDASIVDTRVTTVQQNSQPHVLSVRIPNGFHCIMCGYIARVRNGKITRLETLSS